MLSWNNRCMVDIVQCYCPDLDKWETQFSLPEALGGIRACTLVLKQPSDLYNTVPTPSMLEMANSHNRFYKLFNKNKFKLLNRKSFSQTSFFLIRMKF